MLNEGKRSFKATKASATFTQDIRDPSGYGLVGMTERATLLGGSLEAGPAPGRGWTVSAVLPRAGASA